MNENIMYFGSIVIILSFINIIIFEVHGGLILQQNFNIFELILGFLIWIYGCLSKSG